MQRPASRPRSHRNARSWVAALLLGPALGLAVDAPWPASIRQGELLRLRVDPGTAVSVDGRAVRVDPAGWFAVAVGRDHREALRIERTAADGTRQAVTLPVQSRDWRIERVDGLPPSTVSPDPELAARIAREQAQVAQARTRDDARSDFLAGFIWPVSGRISGAYGSQRILNGEPRSPHYGLDVAAPTGTPLKAPAAGVVTLAEADYFLTGGTLVLDHGHGVSSTFIHLSAIGVAVGDRVDQGEVIARVGATGRASGPHMHWGMNWFEVRVDPQLLVPSP